jgi:hypothetical protein
MRVRLRVRRPGRVLVTLLLVVAALAVAGVAAAYWTGSVGGAGSGATGTTQPVVLTPATPAAGLYPGQRTDVELTAANPNPAPVLITSLRLDTTQGSGGFGVDAVHAGCATSALSYTTQANGGAGWTVPGSEGGEDGSLSITLPAALAMATDAADACQGAGFTVYLTAGP